ncbi:MAG: transposase [Saprospiraceae bacterium]|nr:transposase [Saprospiraceae bacterium]
MKPVEERKQFIDKTDPKLSLTKQCQLLDISRSSLYTKPKKGESQLNIELMELMDKMHLDHPEYGSKRMFEWLKMDKNYDINQKRIDRLYYRVMRLKALMPGPHTSRSNKEHKNILICSKNLKINRCKEHGIPQIINTDQGSQFTSDDFVYGVINMGIKLSMDGKGRATDNIYIERFWRTIKYEHIYIRPSTTVKELMSGLEWYIGWYNNERRHSSIGQQCPMVIYKKYFEIKEAA